MFKTLDQKPSGVLGAPRAAACEASQTARASWATGRSAGLSWAGGRTRAARMATKVESSTGVISEQMYGRGRGPGIHGAHASGQDDGFARSGPEIGRPLRGPRASSTRPSTWWTGRRRDDRARSLPSSSGGFAGPRDPAMVHHVHALRARRTVVRVSGVNVLHMRRIARRRRPGLFPPRTSTAPASKDAGAVNPSKGPITKESPERGLIRCRNSDHPNPPRGSITIGGPRTRIRVPPRRRSS